MLLYNIRNIPFCHAVWISLLVFIKLRSSHSTSQSEDQNSSLDMNHRADWETYLRCGSLLPPSLKHTMHISVTLHQNLSLTTHCMSGNLFFNLSFAWVSINVAPSVDMLLCFFLLSFWCCLGLIIGGLKTSIHSL